MFGFSESLKQRCFVSHREYADPAAKQFSRRARSKKETPNPKTGQNTEK
jgi:hypothetical protein